MFLENFLPFDLMGLLLEYLGEELSTNLLCFTKVFVGRYAYIVLGIQNQMYVIWSYHSSVTVQFIYLKSALLKANCNAIKTFTETSGVSFTCLILCIRAIQCNQELLALRINSIFMITIII